jgi:N-acetylmuramoyl-L-alanine amidase
MVLALGGARGAGAAPGRIETISYSGHVYERLTDWARSNGLEARWVKKDETLQVNNRSTKILLEVDSRQAEFNGTTFWLSFPVLDRNGSVYLARLDAQTTFQPLLSPPKNRPAPAIRTICLDPGHGGHDPGECAGSRQEKKYTLLLAEEVRRQLLRAGFRVVLTRTRDAYVELSDRADVARRNGADLFVSLHFNAFPSAPSTVQGTEVYCMTPPGAPSTNAQGEGGGAGAFAGNRFNDKNLFLAYQMEKTLAKELGAADRGVKRARFEVLREATMPAILIEAGFLSHPVEGRKIVDAGYRRMTAQAIVDGLQAYKRSVE